MPVVPCGRALYWMALAVAPSSALFFGAVALQIPCGPIAPYTRTILSNSVGPSHQAQVFAAFSAIESIGTLIAPVYSLIYGFSVKEGAASLAFVVMSGSALMSAFIATYVRTNNRLRSTLPDQQLRLSLTYWTTRRQAVIGLAPGLFFLMKIVMKRKKMR